MTSRRRFLETAAGLSGAAIASRMFPAGFTLGAAAPKARVAFVKTTNRAAGVKKAIELLAPPSFNGRDVFIKPNYNSADPTPGATHVDTLNAVLEEVRRLGASAMTVGDRSGMGVTPEVMEVHHLPALARDHKIKTVALDSLADTDWEPITLPGMHWSRGFAFPKIVRHAGAVVTTCCLKTHRFGGHFTMSLKNSVGFAAKQVQGDTYNYMTELHRSPDQRRMIAEINTAYAPAFVVLDGIQGFTTAGPDKGTLVDPQVVLAASDRIALDAVGVALLRYYGTTPEVSKGAIFEQEQIARAVQLGLGVATPDQIEIVTADAASAEYAAKIRTVLDGGTAHA